MLIFLLVEYNEHRLNVMKATELVYYHHGDWEFTYQVFISSVVYPLFQNPQFIDFALELIGKPCFSILLKMLMSINMFVAQAHWDERLFLRNPMRSLD